MYKQKISLCKSTQEQKVIDSLIKHFIHNREFCEECDQTLLPWGILGRRFVPFQPYSDCPHLVLTLLRQTFTSPFCRCTVFLLFPPFFLVLRGKRNRRFYLRLIYKQNILSVSVLSSICFEVLPPEANSLSSAKSVFVYVMETPEPVETDCETPLTYPCCCTQKRR